MTFVQPLTLLTSSNAKWTTTQEKTIARDYPFNDLHLEPPDQFVVRTYLQFLWLPESIMPINLLVPSLRRVQDASPGPLDSPHPLHALLDPLFLSVRSAVAKYHTELPQVLAHDGGEGEMEESMTLPCRNVFFRVNDTLLAGCLTVIDAPHRLSPWDPLPIIDWTQDNLVNLLLVTQNRTLLKDSLNPHRLRDLDHQICCPSDMEVH